LASFQLDVARERMAVLYGWRKTDLKQLMMLAVGLHDLGKLSERWQKGIQAWQYENYPDEGKAANGKPLGHSTFHPENGDTQKEHNPKYERGTHAGEGAAVASPLLTATICGLFEDEEDQYGALSAILSAIARHHSSQVDKIESYQLLAEAEEEVRASLSSVIPLAEINLEACPDQRWRHNIARMLVGIEDSTVTWLPLYWHLVRQVRLVDQEAVKTMVKEKGGR
jgi:CRISPR-associated endonuclease/helicase Cas3